MRAQALPFWRWAPGVSSAYDGGEPHKNGLKTTQPMKAQKKNGQGLYVRKSNNRWKWMAGATAATAAGVTASEGSTITINLLNNYISGDAGNHLNADLTGDGHPDLTITGAFYFTVPHGYYASFRKSYVGVALNGVGAFAFLSHDYGYGSVRLGSKTGHFYRSYGTPSLIGSIPVFFKDLHINGGTPTRGSLEVTVAYAKVQLDSFTYNTPGQGSRFGPAVPDQGSSLGLLAMGAAGILALRRWRAAQERS